MLNCPQLRTDLGKWLYYTPATGFTAADSFTYAIDDGHGATVTGTVTVAIKVENAPSPNLVTTSLGGGSHRVGLNSIPNRTYRLQYTADLDPASWRPFAAPQRFYRSVHP